MAQTRTLGVHVFTEVVFLKGATLAANDAAATSLVNQLATRGVFAAKQAAVGNTVPVRFSTHDFAALATLVAAIEAANP